MRFLGVHLSVFQFDMRVSNLRDPLGRVFQITLNPFESLLNLRIHLVLPSAAPYYIVYRFSNWITEIRLTTGRSFRTIFENFICVFPLADSLRQFDGILGKSTKVVSSDGDVLPAAFGRPASDH